jgi:hypothetical protein
MTPAERELEQQRLIREYLARRARWQALYGPPATPAQGSIAATLGPDRRLVPIGGQQVRTVAGNDRRTASV